MITYEEAIRLIDEHTQPLGLGVRPLLGASGYTLGEDLKAKIDSPPFANSAVDGYGKRFEDLSTDELLLSGEVRAGDSGDVRVPPGTCVRIFTGAPIPPEIVTIVMQEDCEVVDDDVRFNSPSGMGDHIRAAGSDFRRGDVVLSKGIILNPASVGLGISAGHEKVGYFIRPRLGIYTTGDELLPPGEDLASGQIYNSNEAALTEAARPFSARTHCWQVSDDLEEMKMRLSYSLREDDVAITCGGVSVGDYDLVRQAFQALGVTERFWGVAIKPGKPVFFGTYGKKLIFGLPGNPASALVTFYLFCRPTLMKLAGHPNPWPKPVAARMAESVRKKPGRTEFLRGELHEDGSVGLAGGQGSHMLSAMASANCLIEFPADATELNPDDPVEVIPLNWVC